MLVRGWRRIFHFITIGGIIKHWNIKHRMRFIMEFLVGISKERIAMGKGGLRGVHESMHLNINKKWS